VSLTAAETWLRNIRNKDGSWGYLQDHPGRGEPTLLVAAALGEVDVVWLETAELTWERLLLPAALLRVPGTEALREHTCDAFLDLEGIRMARTPGHDGMIPAWPWVEATAPWVEPTCYALLSLRSVGRGDHPRVAQGEAMILDRQCDDGGWNYGNDEVLGAPLESFPGPTAWAVQALPASEAIARALARLEAERSRATSTGLALGLLAAGAQGRDVEPWAEGLRARQEPEGCFGRARVDRTALALAALRHAEGAPHPFLSTPQEAP